MLGALVATVSLGQPRKLLREARPRVARRSAISAGAVSS